MEKVALIDLSIVFRSIWHATEHEEIGYACSKTCSKIQEYASDFKYVAVCADTPPYLRSEFFPEYKGQRESPGELMIEQLNSVRDRLASSGIPILWARGFEADDIIATACKFCTDNGHEVVIFSADKDVLQLVSDKVTVISTKTNREMGPSEVREKFGVDPGMMVDLLALTGDRSDNIPGVRGVGSKTASRWLSYHGGLDGVLQAVSDGSSAVISDTMMSRLAGRDIQKDISLSKSLVRLHDDAPVDCSEIFERQYIHADESSHEPTEETKEPVTEQGVEMVITDVVESDSVNQSQRIQVRADSGWRRALEPSDSTSAWRLANIIHNSGMFSEKFKNPESILTVLLTGRSMGLDAFQSLRNFNMIKGQAAPSSALLVGLVKSSPVCEYFQYEDSDNEKATYSTKRRGEKREVRMVYTIEDAKRAGLSGRKQWQERPKTMLRWRCAAELARAVYPDITAGLYTEEEVEDMEI